MTATTKLELTWIGKENRPRLEPRILIADDQYSYHAQARRPNDIFDNLLIRGDNLLALKALQSDYAGQVKCVYIDPPYNIDVTGALYEDGLEHSSWLSLMRERLVLLRDLLRDDGLIFVQIDDEEFAYLQVLMDEVFGRRNRVNTICVKMSEASGVKMAHAERRLPKLKEYILVYRKAETPPMKVELVPVGQWNEEYKTVLTGITDDDLQTLKSKLGVEGSTDEDVNLCNALLKDARLISLAEYVRKEGMAKGDIPQWRQENANRIVQAVGSSSVLRLAQQAPARTQDVAAVRSSTGLIYLYKTAVDFDSKQPRVQVIFADENLMRNPGDFWQDIKTTGGVGQEGGVLFPNGKKPERLLWRILDMCTAPGDLVLDSFAGSGTTGAVAHKMGRRWIMVELRDHCETHIVKRLKRVIDGDDNGGVTGLTQWKGGGGFRYCRLAPSLLEKDHFGHWVISESYNGEMLAEAMCKHFDFAYAPSAEQFWMHGHSSEADFIYVTTASLTHDQLRAISEEVGEERTLLICCKAFQTQNPDSFKNLTLRKIPAAVLNQCEWGKDDYSLKIENLPMMEDDEEDEPQAELFDGAAK